MLTESEETRLNACLDIAKKNVVLGYQMNEFSSNTVLWLTEKLKEINDECSKVHEELQKANEELARVHEVYGP